MRRATCIIDIINNIVDNFYPRSPCGERHGAAALQQINDVFLSTLSLRRATRRGRPPGLPGQHFYPRSPCGERRDLEPEFIDFILISIHALLAESDYVFFGKNKNTAISIHALLAESDQTKKNVLSAMRYFYPRSPCGERRGKLVKRKINHHFYPRSPCGERLLSSQCYPNILQFLSTLSLRRATFNCLAKDSRGLDFYPRSPCGERLTNLYLDTCRHDFYPRSPCGERLSPPRPLRSIRADFYPRSPCGERLHQDAQPEHLPQISIHALLAESDGWKRTT